MDSHLAYFYTIIKLILPPIGSYHVMMMYCESEDEEGSEKIYMMRSKGFEEPRNP